MCLVSTIQTASDGGVMAWGIFYRPKLFVALKSWTFGVSLSTVDSVQKSSVASPVTRLESSRHPLTNILEGLWLLWEHGERRKCCTKLTSVCRPHVHQLFSCLTAPLCSQSRHGTRHTNRKKPQHISIAKPGCSGGVVINANVLTINWWCDSSASAVIIHYMRGQVAPQQNSVILEAAHMVLITLKRVGYFYSESFFEQAE